MVPGVWKHPAVVTEPMILEYRRWLDALRKVDAPAQDGRIRVWLSKLLFGLSGNFSEEMIQGKMGAFAFALADKPAFCFDDATLRRAQKHFKSFWPSAGELIEFMEGIEREARVRAERAWKVVDGGTRAAGAPRTRRPWAEGGAEDHAEYLREKQNRERQQLVEIMRDRNAAAGKFAADEPMPERLPDETVKAYVVNRLNPYTYRQISLGDKARRKDEERRLRAAEIDANAKTAKPVKRPATPPPTGEQTRAAYAETKIKPKDVRETADAEVPS